MKETDENVLFPTQLISPVIPDVSDFVKCPGTTSGVLSGNHDERFPAQLQNT